MPVRKHTHTYTRAHVHTASSASVSKKLLTQADKLADVCRIKHCPFPGVSTPLSQRLTLALSPAVEYWKIIIKYKNKTICDRQGHIW